MLLTRSAGLAFGAVLLVSPLRLALAHVERPTANLYPAYTDFFFYPSDLFLLLTLALWIISQVIAPRRVKLGPWFLSAPLAGLVILSCIGIPTSIDPALTLYHSARLMLLLLLYLYLVNAALSPAQVTVPLAIGSTVQGLVAAAQFAQQRSIGLAQFGELALDPNETGPSILRVGDQRFLRAYGLTDHPNVLGGFLAFSIVLLVGYYLSLRPDRRRYLLLGPLGIACLGLFYSFSRAAIASLLAGVSFLVGIQLLYSHSRREVVRDMVAAATVVALVIVIPIASNQMLLTQRVGGDDSFALNPGEQRSLVERDALFASALRIFSSHPLTGVGIGTLPLAMYQLDDQFPKEFFFQPAHLVLLDAAAELGFLGGLLWLWLLTAPLIAVVILRRSLFRTLWLVVTASALIVLYLIGFFDYYTWLLEPGRLWQWSAWGLLAICFQTVHLTEKAKS